MFRASYDYDAIIIGGGAAGLTAAKTAKGFGKKVAIIENNKLGGECTWTGCVPSKTLIKAAEIMRSAKQASRYGITPASNNDYSTQSLFPHIRSVIEEVYQTHTPEALSKDGIEVIFGNFSFLDAHTISDGTRTFKANKFFIATGSKPFIPPIKGLDTVSYLTNRTLFELEKLPKSVVIIGGGAIGAEVAPALARLGVQVTLLESKDRLLINEEQELVYILTKLITDAGVSIHTNTTVTSVEQQGNEIKITYEDETETKEMNAEALLIATGRKAQIDGLNLEKAGVAYTDKAIQVDTYLRTTAFNIYACGDVIGSYQFSHLAWHEAVAAVRNAFIPFFKKKMNNEYVTWITFSDYEFAVAGVTEEQARARLGDSIRVYRTPFAEIDRAHIDRVDSALAKFICDKNGRILGAHILGPRAGELIHEIQVARVYNIPLHDLAQVIHAYPSYSDVIWVTAKKSYREYLEKSYLVKAYTWLLKNMPKF